VIEISVKVSNDEQRLTQRFTHYDPPITASMADPQLNQMVQSTIENFKGNVDDVLVSIKMVWK